MNLREFLQRMGDPDFLPGSAKADSATPVKLSPAL